MVRGQQPAHFGPCRLDGREALLAGALVVDSGDTLVFTEIDDENGISSRGAVVLVVEDGVRECVQGKPPLEVSGNRKSEQLSDYRSPASCMDSFGRTPEVRCES